MEQNPELVKKNKIIGQKCAAIKNTNRKYMILKKLIFVIFFIEEIKSVNELNVEESLSA